MKLLSTLTLATVLATVLATGAAFAASNDVTPTATPAPSATPAASKHSTTMHCEKEAKAKKLSGDAAAKFVRECKQGRKG